MPVPRPRLFLTPWRNFGLPPTKASSTSTTSTGNALPIIHHLADRVARLPRGLLVHAQKARHHDRRDAFGGGQHEEHCGDPDPEIQLRRVERRPRGDSELAAAFPLDALIQPGAHGCPAQRARTQAAAMWTEPIIAPDGVLEEEPRMTFGWHLLPDIADGLQFGNHGVASLRGNPEDWLISPSRKRLRYGAAGTFARQGGWAFPKALLFLVDNRESINVAPPTR